MTVTPHKAAEPVDGEVERAVTQCPACEGGGTIADGMDEAACSTDCPRCGGIGYIVDLAAIGQQDQGKRIAELEAALEKLIVACDEGQRFERGAGGMTIDAQIRRTVINGVSAWAVEEARAALTGATK